MYLLLGYTYIWRTAITLLNDQPVLVASSSRLLPAVGQELHYGDGLGTTPNLIKGTNNTGRKSWRSVGCVTFVLVRRSGN